MKGVGMTDANVRSASRRGRSTSARIEKAVREILFAIGEDPDRDGLLRTPARVAEMYAEICAGLTEDPAQPSRGDLRGQPRRDGARARHRALQHLRASPHSVPRTRARRVHPRRRRPHHRPVEAGAARRRLREAAAGAGTAHDAGRRRDRRGARAARRVRDDRSRASVHVDARRAQAGNAHRHVRGARTVQGESRRPGPRSCRCWAPRAAGTEPEFRRKFGSQNRPGQAGKAFASLRR